MSRPASVVEPEALSRAEAVYRQHLIHEPDDTVARLSLAWCLFMQALHQAGRESVLGVGSMVVEPLAGPSEVREGAGSRPICDGPAFSGMRTGAAELDVNDPEARNFLLDCLRQTTAVVHLSRSAQDRRDVERLRALVRLCNGDEVMSAAEAEAVEILDGIAREMGRPRRAARLRRLAGGDAE